MNDQDQLLKAEKDSIVFLGLLSRVLALFDSPIPIEGKPPESNTHFAGLNIHACAVDNRDGELLAVEHNAIHATQNPMEHGEQRTLRNAVARVLEKRPRPLDMTVEDYYRNQMFMAPGTALSDYLRTGGTCYTTLEPCPMCTSTLLVCRMKRVVFILPDRVYGGAWPDLTNHCPAHNNCPGLYTRYYSRYAACYEQLNIDGTCSALTGKAAAQYKSLLAKVDDIYQAFADMPATLLLDYCRDQLVEAAGTLRTTHESDLATTGPDFVLNARLLSDMKRACNFPHSSSV